MVRRDIDFDVGACDGVMRIVIRDRVSHVVPPDGEAGTVASVTKEDVMAQKGAGYGRSWKRLVAIYVVAGAVVYLIAYLVFFAHGGSGGGY